MTTKKTDHREPTMPSRKTTMAPPADLPQLVDLPLDLSTMRAAADRLLAEDAEPPSQDELETLTLQLRGHLMLTIPEVEQLAGQLDEDTTPRVTALAGVGEARIRLDLEPGSNLPAGVAHAQRLARSVAALCTTTRTSPGPSPACGCWTTARAARRTARRSTTTARPPAPARSRPRCTRRTGRHAAALRPSPDKSLARLYP